MSPQGTRIAIVQVCNRLAEFARQVVSNIETGPIGMHEVRRTFRAEHAGGTGRPGRIQADNCDVGERPADDFNGNLKPLRNLL